MVAEGWEEKEICTKGVLMVKNKERGGVGEWKPLLCLFIYWINLS